MRRTILAGLVLLAGPALAQNADWKAVDDCYRLKTVELDDFSSDAETIAKAVSFSCSSTERQFARVGRLEEQTTQAMAELRDAFVSRATVAVLVRRVMIRRGELKP